MTSEGGGEGAAAWATRHVNLQPGYAERNDECAAQDRSAIGAHQIADLKHDVAHNMSANRFRRKIFMLTSTVRSLCAPKVRHQRV
jgi:hypothetical protein